MQMTAAEYVTNNFHTYDAYIDGWKIVAFHNVDDSTRQYYEEAGYNTLRVTLVKGERVSKSHISRDLIITDLRPVKK